MKRLLGPGVVGLITVCLLAGNGVTSFNTPPSSGSVQNNRAIALVDVSVVPMDVERVMIGQTVIIKEGRIIEFGPASRTKVPDDALKIDAKGKYLMPGLADMHVHLHDFDEPANRAMFQLFLANGVTTILNLYGTPHHLELRERIKRGELLAPVVYTSGPFVSDASAQKTPKLEEVERAVIEHKRAGYDFIKIHGDFSREAYRKLFEVARREGMRVIGHAPRNLGIEAIFEERQHAIAHAEEYIYAYFYFKSEKSIRNANLEEKNRFFSELATRIPSVAQATANAGVWVIPNLTAYKGIGLQAKDIKPVLARPEVKYVPQAFAKDWQPERNTYVLRFSKGDAAWYFEKQYVLLEKLVKAFRDAGVPMLAGTDTPIPSIVPGFSLHDELSDLVAAGLTPYEAIRTATVNAARFLEALDQAGTIAVGKRADLVLIDGDPLKDVRNIRRISGVMAGGRWLPRDELQKTLSALASRQN